MRVLHAAKFYAPVSGGMETVVKDLCDGTAATWDVQVVAANNVGRSVEERVGGVRVVRSATFGSAHSVPLCPFMPMQLWKAEADCVVLHEPNPIAGSALFLKSPARRLVIWHHSDLVRPRWAPHTYGRIQAALYRRADCVIVSSPNLAAGSSLVQLARHVAVIPFGVPLDRYRRTDPERSGAVAAVRRSTAGPLVLFVGRLVYYKGVHVLIDAMASCPGTLMIAGDGPLERDLRRHAVERGVAERVKFLGRLSEADLPAYYQAADVFVLPSIARTEAFGVVQLEAMAAGVPVISTSLPTGVPWVNQDGVTGFVVAPDDASALSAAVRRVVEDRGVRERLSAGASARATALFARERMVDRFRRVIETLVRAPEQLGAELARVEG